MTFSEDPESVHTVDLTEPYVWAPVVESLAAIALHDRLTVEKPLDADEAMFLSGLWALARGARAMLEREEGDGRGE